MGRTPKPDAHRTGLQRRLSAEVRAGMALSERSQADLSRITGIGEPHISLLLRGLRQGTITAWDKLLRAAHGSVSPIIRLPEGARVTADGTGIIVSPAPPNGEEIATEILEPLGAPVTTDIIQAAMESPPNDEPTEMGVAFQRAESERNRPAASSLNPRRPL